MFLNKLNVNKHCKALTWLKCFDIMEDQSLQSSVIKPTSFKWGGEKKSVSTTYFHEYTNNVSILQGSSPGHFTGSVPHPYL